MLAVAIGLMTLPAHAASPSGTLITTAGSSIIDSSNSTWTLTNSPGNGLVIDRNGVQTVSANVIALTYINGKVYQENKALGWWYWNGKGWMDTANPLTSSPNDTAVPPDSRIIDNSKNIWTVSDGVIFKNGQAAGYSANVIELYYGNDTVYQKNNELRWWSWGGLTWVNADDPTGNTTVATGGLPPDNTSNPSSGSGSSSAGTGGPSPAGISVDLSSPMGHAVPASLWGVATGALIDNSFSGATSSAFQTSFKSLNIQSLRFNVNSGANEGLWEDAIFAGGVNSPNWNYLDRWFNTAPSFWNTNGRLIVGVGPSGGSAQHNPSDWATIAVQLASHFKSKGMEVFYWEVGNEPDGNIDINTYNAAFNAIAQALHKFNPNYKVGGPVTSWDNGSYITPWAQQCGSNADFTNWHSYPINTTDSDAAMYQKGIEGELNNVPGEIAGTAMAGKPYALLEYNINGNPGSDPRQVTYKNAVYTALRLTETYKQNPLFQMGGIWDIMADSNYGIVGPNGSSSSVIVPVGYYLGKASQVMPGTQVPASVDVSANLKVFATVNGNNSAIQIVNYDTSATYTIGVTAKLPGGGNFGGNYNVWQIGSTHPNVPETGNISYNTSLSIPPATVVILTAAQ